MTPNCSTWARCPTTSGLVEGHRSEHDRFEVDGANAARDVLREHGNAVRTVRDAIALHRAQTRTIARGDQALANRFRRPPCLTVGSAPWLSNEPRTHRGVQVASDEHSLTVGPNGPTVLQKDAI